MAFNDANTVLYAGFNGADGATTYTADSGQVATFSGTAQLDTAIKKYGTASLLLDGNSDYITFPDEAGFQLGGGTGAFTIDCYVYLTAGLAAHRLVGQPTSATNWWSIYLYSTDAGATAGAYFNIKSGGSTIHESHGVSSRLTSGAWHRVTLVRVDGGNTAASWRYFFDGFSVTPVLDSGAWNATIPDISDVLYIGYEGSAYYGGNIDDLEISNVARWTTDFGSNIKKVSGQEYANIKKISSIAIANVKKCSGVA